jgi:uncharacterized protein (DUF427 family)
VWDYPRPPAIDHDPRLVEVHFAGVSIAATHGALRVLETSHPPGYYVPFADVMPGALVGAAGGSFCEWKGVASYWDVTVNGQTAPQAAWSYPDPSEGYGELAGFVSFYPGRVDGCFVAGERVRPQAGGFYGGWILDEIVGPFKGEPGTRGW